MAQVSPPSKTKRLSAQLAAFGAKLTNTLDGSSSPRSPSLDTRDPSVSDADTAKARSVSRGRDAYQSSGRGGAGNIRPTSGSREPADDNLSPTRGRERITDPTRVYSTGRGGVGNLRSPSREAGQQRSTSIPPAEQELIRKRLEAEAEGIHSTGRGGLGNIKPRSRSRDAGGLSNVTSNVSHATHDSSVHSTGRGGAGNIMHGDVPVIEEERIVHAHEEGLHATGRGGFANITVTQAPKVEQHAHHEGEYSSSGRGGAGNIRSHSRDPDHKA